MHLGQGVNVVCCWYGAFDGSACAHNQLKSSKNKPHFMARRISFLNAQLSSSAWMVLTPATLAKALQMGFFPL
jgi:hypothetical protein